MKIYKAYAKVNIFLKVTGKRGAYHEIVSRFMLVKDLYDELKFVKKENPSDKFIIDGDFSCTIEQNTIHKAYIALKEYTNSKSLEKLMQEYLIDVKKSIPAFAGLGGGSSDAATYLMMCNEILELSLSLDELAKIGLKVGADVPFFIYGYESANVAGIGEIVEKFDEKALRFDIYTPDVKISTPKVYKRYRESFYNPITKEEEERLKCIRSKDVFRSMDPKEANDLFKPALYEYKELESYFQDGYYFSGSGSSFFKMIEKEN